MISNLLTPKSFRKRNNIPNDMVAKTTFKDKRHEDFDYLPLGNIPEFLVLLPRAREIPLDFDLLRLGLERDLLLFLLEDGYRFFFL